MKFNRESHKTSIVESTCSTEAIQKIKHDTNSRLEHITKTFNVIIQCFKNKRKRYYIISR